MLLAESVTALFILSAPKPPPIINTVGELPNIPNLSLGIDPVLGDIFFDPNEIPIRRGGWYDRNGVYFSNSLDDSSLKSINIIKKGVIDSKNRNNF